MRYTTHGTNGFTANPKDEAMKRVVPKDTSVTTGGFVIFALWNCFLRLFEFHRSIQLQLAESIGIEIAQVEDFILGDDKVSKIK